MSRRSSIQLSILLAALACCAMPSVVGAQRQKELGVESFIYVGTHASETSAAKGIYLFRMRTSDDPNIPEFVKVTPLGLVAETPNPSYLEIDAKRRLLFCVNEIEKFPDNNTGAVSAFAIDPATGTLTPLTHRSSMGKRPCHLALDRKGNYLLVANDDGAIAMLRVRPDGRLGPAIDLERHAGKAVHPRGVAFSPDNRFAFVCDSGLDRVIAYAFDAAAGQLTPHEPGVAQLKPGAGPRRMVFHHNGKFAYVVNESNSTVTAFAYDPASGVLKELQTLSTLPEYYDGPNTAAEIGIHPSGKCLLVSNCGHHSVVLFTLDPEKGTLAYVEDQSTYGSSPVHFGFDAAGKHVVVANRDSGSILILRAPENARVKPGGNVVETPSPACAKFLAR